MASPEFIEAMYTTHFALVEEIRAHNLAVTRRRRLGGDYDAPENQYRNAITEIEALRDDQP
jgi:hypothetical protein